MKSVQVAGLAMPLPVLAHGHYPECALPLLQKTLADPQARALPDYCLLRFPDFTVAPGQTYEYRVRVRMANPNYGKKARGEGIVRGAQRVARPVGTRAWNSNPRSRNPVLRRGREGP